MKRLIIEIEYSKEDQGFIGGIKGVELLKVFGSSERECLSNFADLLKGLAADEAIDEVLAAVNR
jgi:hypothetical protein